MCPVAHVYPDSKLPDAYNYLWRIREYSWQHIMKSYSMWRGFSSLQHRICVNMHVTCPTGSHSNSLSHTNTQTNTQSQIYEHTLPAVSEPCATGLSLSEPRTWGGNAESLKGTAGREATRCLLVTGKYSVMATQLSHHLKRVEGILCISKSMQA